MPLDHRFGGGVDAAFEGDRVAVAAPDVLQLSGERGTRLRATGTANTGGGGVVSRDTGRGNCAGQCDMISKIEYKS